MAPPSSEHQQHHFFQNQNPPLFVVVDTLYCSEEHWEDDEQLHQDNNVVVHDGVDDDDYDEISYLYNKLDKNKTNPQPDLHDFLEEHDLFWENDELVALFSKQDEQQQIHQKNVVVVDDDDDYDQSNTLTTLFGGARCEAIEWILKVQCDYSFSPQTFVLAVHYLDRFVSRFHFQNKKPWMTQLVSVACLSLAAKMEETHVPLLVDFQVEETKYVFEAKTIQRMEILVLSTLEWKMNLATPLSFIDHIIRRLGFKTHLCWEFLSRCESIVVSVLSDARYMCYLPSVIATAVMLHVIDSIDSRLLAEHRNQLLGILRTDKEKLDKCSELITELTLQNNANKFNKSNKSNKRKLGSMPASPNGVIDLSFSSDSSNDSWVVAASVSSSPEPLAKKLKKGGQDMHSLVHDMVG